MESRSLIFVYLFWYSLLKESNKVITMPKLDIFRDFPPPYPRCIQIEVVISSFKSKTDMYMSMFHQGGKEILGAYYLHAPSGLNSGSQTLS